MSEQSLFAKENNFEEIQSDVTININGVNYGFFCYVKKSCKERYVPVFIFIDDNDSNVEDAIIHIDSTCIIYFNDVPHSDELNLKLTQLFKIFKAGYQRGYQRGAKEEVFKIKNSLKSILNINI